MITQATIQQILSRIDIIDVVGSFVKLKKRGTNYLGLCPFHNEKTPSFTVSPNKEIYKCFGCGKSGNTISFVMEHEKYSYVEALKWLAGRYNVEVEETEVSAEVKAQQQVADSLYILNGFAQKYFSEVLLNDEEGQDIAFSYLKERGFNEAIIEKFHLGYCKESRNAFVTEALSKQYNRELLVKSGLVALRNEELVDNYRGRIIFPIHNTTGKVIGFGARIIKKNDRAPKYINTPENEIYIKSRILYGMFFARQVIDKFEECLLVEGYTDVISLHQAGIENVVASGGTSLTTEQIRLVRKYTNNLTIIYDGDAAGIKAALRGLDMALEEGLNVKLVLIPDKEDPDSYVNKVGAEAFRQFVAENKKDFIIFQLEVALKDAGTDSQKKAAVVNQMAETLSRINKAEDFTRQQDYIRQCSELLQIEESGFTNLVNKFIREKVNKLESKQFSEQAYSHNEMPPPMDFDGSASDEGFQLLLKDELQERAVVRALIEFGSMQWDDNNKVADHIFSECVEDDLFDNKKLLEVINTYKLWYDAGLEPTAKNFFYHENQELSAVVVSLLEFPYELSDKWKDKFEMAVSSREESYKQEVISTLGYLKLRKIKRMIDENQKDLGVPHSPEEQLNLLATHKALKDMERELLRHLGTVIVR
ncbi:DNA primase [Flavihumibacter sp. ZG627]|uniref:DNA primase n=1 Tax=Flavihumibacter sp. ZG627 TaxID=1463156 RepID=UPI00057E4781|nr:DNA primase [Flavihumibacter sp. ZG627]KIC91751.1 DNA primase [Flavihumibacter sp. ZG627]